MTIVSLELLLDEATEERVRAEWAALAEAGLSSLAGHTAASNRPHVTMLVRPASPHLAAAAVAERMAGPGVIPPPITLPLPLRLGAPVLFGAGDRRVLARSVVPSAALLRLHEAIHTLLGPGDDAAHTRPGEWTPHVTLARRLRVETLPQALALLDDAPTGAATTLRHWDAGTTTVTDLIRA